MLIEHIERLRKQPVHVRKKYAYLYASLITGVIVLVWLSVLMTGKAQRATNPTFNITPEIPAATDITKDRFFESANTFFEDVESTLPRDQRATSVSPVQNTLLSTTSASTGTSTSSSESLHFTSTNDRATTATTTTEGAGFIDEILNEGVE